MARLTHIRLNPVSATRHNLVVIASPQLAECRQSGDSHPDLEMLIFPEVGETVDVAVRVLSLPVGRRQDIGRRIIGRGRRIILGDASPSDSVFGEVVRLVLVAICNEY
jgi:hypothetical protein